MVHLSNSSTATFHSHAHAHTHRNATYLCTLMFDATLNEPGLLQYVIMLDRPFSQSLTNSTVLLELLQASDTRVLASGLINITAGNAPFLEVCTHAVLYMSWVFL